VPGLEWGVLDTHPPPPFFVSVASKGVRVHVSGLESTLAGVSTSVDSKEVAWGEKDNSRTGHLAESGFAGGRPV